MYKINFYNSLICMTDNLDLELRWVEKETKWF